MSADDRCSHLSINSWLETKRLEGRTTRTIKYYRDTAERLAGYLGKDPKDATSAEIRSFLASLQSTCSNVTINNYRRNINSYYQYLEDEDVIQKSPMRRIHYIKEEKRVKTPFTDEELARIVGSCNSKVESAVVLFLSTTACRVGELVGILTANVDMIEREATVYGKGRKERIVFFDARTKIALDEYLSERNDESPYLFATRRGTRYTVGAIEQMVRNVGTRANVEHCHPHRFRRTVATRALDRGMPIEQVKELLGHSQIQTTLIYASVSKNNVKESHRRYVQ